MLRQPDKKIYLYGRLSHEDELNGDSNSIINQRKILTKYAEENGFTPYEFIYDDGYSGADFERPSFARMIEEVEAGNVSTIIVKDMSRFGRDYLKVGFYTEILFSEKNVRLIAINDNIDTERVQVRTRYHAKGAALQRPLFLEYHNGTQDTGRADHNATGHRDQHQQQAVLGVISIGMVLYSCIFPIIPIDVLCSDTPKELVQAFRPFVHQQMHMIAHKAVGEYLTSACCLIIS